jgi:hypothetical protein
MKIFEVDSFNSSPGIDTGKLFQLANFLMNRAKDTASAAEINKETFLKLASNLGVNGELSARKRCTYRTQCSWARFLNCITG